MHSEGGGFGRIVSGAMETTGSQADDDDYVLLPHEISRGIDDELPVGRPEVALRVDQCHGAVGEGAFVLLEAVQDHGPDAGAFCDFREKVVAATAGAEATQQVACKGRGRLSVWVRCLLLCDLGVVEVGLEVHVGEFAVGEGGADHLTCDGFLPRLFDIRVSG